MKKLTIKEWAAEDRPREKMLEKGVSTLSDAELIAILLGSGNDTETVVQLSQRILFSVGNDLNQLGKLSVKDLVNQFRGIGNVKAAIILAALELGRRRTNKEIIERKRLNGSHEVWLFFHPFLSDLPYEELWMILMNSSGKMLNYMKISQGGMTGTAADIRIILKLAIERFASGIILCHNHPSGSLTPSRQDDDLTARLKKAANIMDMQLLDHLILTDTSYYSYADQGRIL